MSFNNNVENYQLEIISHWEIDRLSELTRELYAEIGDLQIESVGFVKEQSVPLGAKSGDLEVLGKLLVSVVPIALPSLIAFLQAWSMRREGRSVKIKSQSGDRSVEVEFNPSIMSRSEIQKLAQKLSETLEERKDASS